MMVISPRNASSIRGARPWGFTLIEVVFVMVIMAVLITVAIPRMMQTNSEERATTERLRSTLRYVQRMAVTRNRDVCVTVSATTVVFKVAGAAGTAVLCDPMLQASLGDGELLDVTLPTGSPMLFAPAPLSFRFTPSGVLTDNTGATLGVTSLSLKRGPATYSTLSIQPDNGFVLASVF